jgi:hypothetical protein
MTDGVRRCRAHRAAALILLIVCAFAIAPSVGARAAQSTSDQTVVAHRSKRPPDLATQADVTEIIRWSPFGRNGQVRKTLNLHRRAEAGGCDDYSYVYTYRCWTGHVYFRPCWRDPRRATAALCATHPWTKSIERIRVPDLMLESGVTFEYRAPENEPWGLELMDGNRCTLFLGGAHSSVPGHEDQVIDYYCTDSGVLLFGAIRRGHPWRIGAVRRHNGRYDQLGDVAVRRAYVTDLPAEMKRQQVWARSAATTALSAYARAKGSVDKSAFVGRVRLAVPNGEWANVQVLGQPARKWNVVLRRVGDRWTEVHGLHAYGEVARLGAVACPKVPAFVLRQLFSSKECIASRSGPDSRRSDSLTLTVVLALVLALLVAAIVGRRRLRRQNTGER